MPVFAVSLLLALATAPAAPTIQPRQAAQPSPAADAERLAAAMDLFEPAILKQQMLAGVLHMANAAMDVELKAREEQGQAIPESLVTRLKAVTFEDAEELVDDMAPSFRADAAAIYAQRFTAAELREIKAIQAQPVMRKMEKLAPEMMAEIAKIGMAKAAERAPELKRKIEQTVQEWLANEGAGAVTS